MLISPAYAQAAGGAGGFDILSLAPLVLIFIVFYFLLIRPQQKKVKEHKEMLSKIRRKDRVVTSGGILGTVTKANDNDDNVKLEIAEGVVVEVRRSMIAEVVSRSEPVNDSKADSDSKSDKNA
jgi:preprotein translocase subunit YajC